MLGLFGTLELGTRSLQTQRMGVEVAGHNIANVNNPSYSRQRLDIATATPVQGPAGPQGTGAEAVAITRIRSSLIDLQIQSENSVSGYLEAQQKGLQFAQAGLGQAIQSAAGTSGSGQHGIGDTLNELFAAFQSLSNAPSSVTERQTVLVRAEDLAQRFNATAQRLDSVSAQLNEQVQIEAQEANALLAEIATLNQQIARAELGQPGAANDLRDLRQSKLEGLSSLAAVQVSENEDGTLEVSIGGTTLVSGQSVTDKLEIYDPGNSRCLIRAQSTAAPITMTAGSIAGALDLRDGELAALRDGLDQLASNLISEVNRVHGAGFNLAGSSGAPFFSGTTAGDIAVNPALVGNPSLLQASGVAGESGDNQVVLALANLASKPITSLGNRTFGERYGLLAGDLGHGLASVNSRLEDQQALQSMLAAQRDSVSGVSLDEEMTSMMKFQKAYEASARLVSVISEMLDTLIQMKR